MDNVDGRDQDEHDHHIEGSSTSCIDNFLIVTKFLDSIRRGKKKKVKDKQVSILIDSLFIMNISI
jgi:hypothetical protein